jgi:hypothetical protein
MSEEYVDPGERLQQELDARKPTMNARVKSSLGELLYTASERGILPFSLDIEDVEKVLKLAAIASEMTPRQIDKFRM